MRGLERSGKKWGAASRFAAIAVLLLSAGQLRAQAIPGKADPTMALEDMLSAACRQDQTDFATHLTADNAAAFHNLPDEQRVALIKRFVLLEDPGKPLLTTSAEGHPIVRCDGAGVISEMRFGATELHDNLAFIRVEVPQAGETKDGQVQNVRFGLVREDGEWKLISIGVLMLDIPSLQREWERGAISAREADATGKLRTIAKALQSYQTAYGKLPDALDQLASPADGGGLSPEKAGLLDNELASGESDGYRFRYSIVPTNVPGDDSDRDKAAGFSLAATPVQYGKDGKRSFYLDASGTLRGADKQGAVATPDDPPVSPDAQP